MPITITILLIALLINLVGFFTANILVNLRLAITFSILLIINAVTAILVSIQY